MCTRYGVSGKEVTGDTNSDSDSRRRSRSPRNDTSRNLRPKGSDDAAPAKKEDQKQSEDEESEIVIPEAKRIPNTPRIAEYMKHQVMHYPFQDWCPICVKNAANNKPHQRTIDEDCTRRLKDLLVRVCILIPSFDVVEQFSDTHGTVL